jgi:hypothetical protein
MTMTHNAAARLGVAVNSDNGYWTSRCAGTTTQDTVRFLTSLRVS